MNQFADFKGQRLLKPKVLTIHNICMIINWGNYIFSALLCLTLRTKKWPHYWKISFAPLFFLLWLDGGWRNVKDSFLPIIYQSQPCSAFLNKIWPQRVRILAKNSYWILFLRASFSVKTFMITEYSRLWVERCVFKTEHAIFVFKSTQPFTLWKCYNFWQEMALRRNLISYCKNSLLLKT